MDDFGNGYDALAHENVMPLSLEWLNKIFYFFGMNDGCDNPCDIEAI